MAFASSKYQTNRGLTVGEALKWVALPGAGIALTIWTVTLLASVGSIGATLNAASIESPSGLMASMDAGYGRTTRLASRLDLGVEKSGRVVAPSDRSTAKFARLDDLSLRARFDKVAADAAVSSEKLAAAVMIGAAKQRYRRKSATSNMMAAANLPVQERFGGATLGDLANPQMFARFSKPEAAKPVELALATVGPTADDALNVLMPSLPDSVSVDAGAIPGETSPETALPGVESAPDSVPLPQRRPEIRVRPEKPSASSKLEDTGKPDAPPSKVDKRDDSKTAARAPVLASRDPANTRRPLMRSQRSDDTLLAYAKPDDPAEDVSGVFKNLFSAPGKGSGVAVYDISAKTVRMPDGTVLEAHSGIGAMADNPRFVDRKMNGPTPPDTYNLVMRESRFHGVEAIRLLPADGKVKHNRTGLLAHSYLLRGGKAQSHGCVAFKDYAKFLAAFKKGKVKRLVVVS